ncbi:DUF441 domain-containing protein [Sporomusa sp.]|uniref:DUF441 domain-containing protein n=1 Tax=Sporomusa sp. TaxID=2078658 RepID=UPI002C13825D|nr:DUF441 domain-containing protein [Sporomusa sp.]MDF2876878.1 hypothetical protein [Sporomusa sp.]HWR06715.1 DUF441 domain-containing protein [Sporomusa sp.]
MSPDNIPILIILVLSVIAKNQTVSAAAAILLIIKLLGFSSWFSFLENRGINIGITILTLAILTPLASGKITLRDMYDAITSPVGLLAVITGVFAAWLGGKGVLFFKASPDTITSLVLGTIVGVSFFQGIAVGPLIAAGMLSLVAGLFGK